MTQLALLYYRYSNSGSVTNKNGRERTKYDQDDVVAVEKRDLLQVQSSQPLYVLPTRSRFIGICKTQTMANASFQWKWTMEQNLTTPRHSLY